VIEEGRSFFTSACDFEKTEIDNIKVCLGWSQR